MCEPDRQSLKPRREQPGRRWLPWLAVLLAGCAACRPQEPAGLSLDGIEIHVRGHREAEVLADGSLRPLVLGRRDPIGLCLAAPATRDTSQWEASLTLGDLPAPPPPFAPPTARMGTTLCFDLEIPEPLSAKSALLCAVVRDRFDGRIVELPCHAVRYEVDDSAYRGLMQAIRTTLGEHVQEDPTALIQALDELAREARSAPFPFAGLQLDLIAVHYLRQAGGEGNLSAAAGRLHTPPDWIQDPVAIHWAAQIAYETGTFEMLTPRRLSAAWRHLRDAERAYLLVAHPNKLAPVMRQVEVLALVGAVREAVQRLSGALEECAEAPCSPHVVPIAKDLLAWLITLDPEATRSELRHAAELLDESLARAPTGAADSLERVNTLVNRAYLEQRLQRDPAPFLSEARALLKPLPDGYRAFKVGGWATLVAGLAALDRHDADRALALCGQLTHETSSPDLAAWALSCAAKAHRQGGDLESARGAFARALLLHEHLSPGQLGQAIYLGPGQQADDRYQAARVEIELGRPDQAWDLLRGLDRLTIEARQCLAEKSDVATDPAQQGRREQLLQELIALELPTSARRRQQLEGVQRALRQELVELARQRVAACTIPPLTDHSVRFRAFALEDEIILLEQNAGHEIEVHRRTPLTRGERQQRLDELASALATAAIDDDAWISLVEPLAAALVPEPSGELGEVTTFALHGSLQSVPLGALPLPEHRSSDADGPRWLGEATLPVVTSAASVAPSSTAPASPSGSPLFVVDPRGNLPSGEQLAAFYRDLFPDGRILQGAAATRQALRFELARARWLHIDAHGTYDPAFPELSSLILADAQLPLLELADLPENLELANLSACQSGRWPTTADSGHYGIAGIFARRGAWVVASRADLQDRLAADFNRAFYRTLEESESFPGAFAQALRSLRQRYPAAAWAALFVLRNASSEAEEGQNLPLWTPDENEGLGISFDRRLLDRGDPA